MKLTLVRVVTVATVLTAGWLSMGDAQAHKVKSTLPVTTLDAVLPKIHLVEGWNKIIKIANGDVLYADVSGGKIGEWRVKSAAGNDLQTWIRPSPNTDNLRIWWAPEHGPGRFVEASASTIAP